LATIAGKKSIVLLSTGLDTSAPKEIQDLLQHVETSDVRILAVSLTGNLRNPPSTTKKKVPRPNAALATQHFTEADALLRQIAESTGGQAFFPATAADLSAAFAQIAQTVRHEFSLAFVPPTPDGAIHTLEVRVDADPAAASQQMTYRVSYRRAYIAPQPINP
jgi:VWFA-related protein